MFFAYIVMTAVVLSTVILFEPRVDKTKDGDILLWVNTMNHKRKYIVLWHGNS